VSATATSTALGIWFVNSSRIESFAVLIPERPAPDHRQQHREKRHRQADARPYRQVCDHHHCSCLASSWTGLARFETLFRSDTFTTIRRATMVLLSIFSAILSFITYE
jgi:hypothetical protein